MIVPPVGTNGEYGAGRCGGFADGRQGSLGLGLYLPVRGPLESVSMVEGYTMV